MGCLLHGASACIPCARMALKAQTEASTPHFNKRREQVVTPAKSHERFEKSLAEEKAAQAEAVRRRVGDGQ